MRFRNCAAFGCQLLLCAFLLQPSMVAAQGTIRFDQKYIETINRDSEIAPVAVDSFGDNVDLSSGSAQFRWTDIDVAGNSGLPVRLQRSLVIEDKVHGAGDLDGFGSFGTLDIPYVKGIFGTNGWQVIGANPNARCTAPTSPPSYGGGTLTASDYWSGNWMHIPWEGEQALLTNPAAALPKPSGGTTMMTKNFWAFGCTTATKNGYAGEGFIAISPKGEKYYFDWVVSKPYAGMSKRYGNYAHSTASMQRLAVYFLVSRIEDRFGNWVNYTYSGDKLTQITSNDGRFIQITWSGSNVASATSSRGSWSYTYTTNSLVVTQPDAAKWTYTTTGGLALEPTPSLPLYDGTPTCPKPEPSIGSYSLAVTQPSGATATFAFEGKRHAKANVPKLCNAYTDDSLMSYQYLTIPNFTDTLTLTTKTITGAGLQSMQWTYSYDDKKAGLAWESVCANPSGPLSCPGIKTTIVRGPDRSYKKYTYGNMYKVNSGQLLQVDEGYETGTAPNVQAVVMRSVANSYMSASEVSAQLFPNSVGSAGSSRFDDVEISLLRPLKQVATTQDGVTFTAQNSAFDVMARPGQSTRFSSLGYTRADVTEYHDDLTNWVLGQAKKVTNTNTGLEVSRTDYDAKALPWKTYSFAKPQQTLTYNADGTLATITDGRGNTTTLSNWKRGLPQTIKYPATAEAPSGATDSVIVNDNGTIASVTDENGYLTSYTYDPMGRLAHIAYPTGDAVAWNAKDIEFRPLTAADWKPAGVAAGQWRQYTTQGKYAKVVYFDALWRPVLTHEYDIDNTPGTLRATSTSYDVSGRVAFQSYPSSDLIPAATGTWSFYDALDRVTSVKQDSELGQLTTSTEYLTGFMTRVTNPRGYQTLTQYVVYDQADTSAPNGITRSAGVDTQAIEIERDTFGAPKRIAQRNIDGSLRADRYYVYDTYHQLCKTVEPETSATVLDYDAAGNLQWTASGLTALTGLNDCDTIAARDSGRKVTRSYDGRNRLTSLEFPDGRGSQSWQYTPDGLPSQITTYNDPNNATPVVNAYGYNKRRLLTAESVSQPGWYSWPIAYGYDANGNLSATNYPTNLTVDYAPNALGQPTKAGTFATGVSYYPNGGIKQFTYGNGIIHAMTQNARQLPARSSDLGGPNTPLNFAYTYDANANVTVIGDDALGGTYSRWMTYDGLDRLTDAGSCSFGGDCWHRFTYDALDNMKSWKLAGVKDYANYYYDTSTNRLTNIQNSSGASIVGLGYDVQGNLQNKNGQNYSFDYGNRLREVTGKEYYRYDAYGRRVLAWQPNNKSVLSQYARGGELLFQHDEQKTTKFEYVYLGGSLVGTQAFNWSTGTYATKYQHTDALGSPVAVSNESAQVIERTQWEPYGAAINKTIDGLGYTGHAMDAATGLTYMQQRYYDPQVGSFLSVDPITAIANPVAHFNRYRYANSNPYRFFDPDGRGSCVTGTIICPFVGKSAGSSRDVSVLRAASKVANGYTGKPIAAPAGNRTFGPLRSGYVPAVNNHAQPGSPSSSRSNGSLTFQIGIHGSAAAVVSGEAGIGLVANQNGSVGIYTVSAYGGGAADDANLSVNLSWSNAATLSQVEGQGTAVSVGGGALGHFSINGEKSDVAPGAPEIYSGGFSVGLGVGGGGTVMRTNVDVYDLVNNDGN